MVSQYRTILRLIALACAPLGISGVYGATTTLTATSSPVNSGKTNQFTQPAVALSVTPNVTTLGPSGSAQFTTIVSYASNKGVSWSLSPAVGTISASGVYTAPASILKPQTVTVMATSAADKTKTSFATVSLMPKVAVALATPAATLGAGQTIQLTPKVTNSSDTSVNWSLSSATGTISQSGVYTAPASITDKQTVVVTATSKVNPAVSASTTVTLAAAAPIVMPIEVMGTSATTRTVQVSVPATPSGSGPIHLWLSIHGLEYQTQASVKVNNSSWIALKDGNAELHGPGKNYGGIGGGYSALSIVVYLPAGTVQTGNNTVSFQFNGTDGNSSGFRVLAFNLQLANGTNILPASAFTADNPAQWAPPSKSASDIAAGKSLYQTATITQPVPGGSPMTLKAHCGDCHTKDGRDLKYFNYSNNSIYVRSMFHGLNSTQANQVVSYIRSLSTPAPAIARPWNPPYQPGPGLDSQPVANWAAGAGLNNVLLSDAAMLPYIAPTQTAADFNRSGNLNIRETPIPYQLIDWNHWLPRIHPVDAYGSAFLSSAANGDYKSLSSALVANNASVYQAQKYTYSNWSGDTTNFRGSVEPGQSDSSWSNPKTAEKIYGIQQWQMVKLWELNQTFGLEGMAQSVFGSQADSRAWYTNAPFQTSPSIGKIPPGSPGIHNGSLATFNNISFLWYYLQLISERRQ